MYSRYELNTKISALNAKITAVVPSLTPGELVVIDKVIVADQYPAPNDTTTINPTSIVLDDGINTNTLDTTKWTGNIQTVNTNANLTHYLNFSDQAVTGYGHPQKTASITCNPALGSITATTFNGSFSGSISSATTAVGVNLTSDNTSGNYYLPFSKTTTPTANALFIDDTTTPLTYNPFTHSLSATTFQGNANSASAVALTSDNTNGNYFITFSKTVNSTSPLFVDNATIPLTYNPSTNTLTATNFNGIVSTASTSSTITLTSDDTAGTYFLPFSKTVGASSALFIDNTTTPLTYNPNTSTLKASIFSGDLSGNATTSTSASSIELTSDDTAGTYFLPFSKTTTPTANALFIDNTTTPLTYNPNTSTLTASIFSGGLSGNATTSTSASSIALTGDNTSGAYFIPFAKTISSSSSLFVDNGTTPLSYNPITSRLACSEFSGDLLGNATTSTNSSFASISTTSIGVGVTNDNANIAYNLVFCAGPLSTANLLVDSLTGPLTYNPSTGDMAIGSVTATTLNASTVNAELRTSSGASTAATFAGTTLTYNCNSVTLRTGTIIFTGVANTVANLSLTGPRNSGIYYIGIRNNGSLGTSFLTGLGANILTKYSTPVVVPAGTSALLSINIITINAIQTTVVGIDLLT